MFMLANI